MSTAKTRVVGSYISPYVRKVLVCLDIKQVPYEIDPIVPFYGSDDFSSVSPLRRIPVLMDDAVSLCDSTVICEYLEERYPGPALLPPGPVERAKARWLEEFADSRMGESFIWHYFNQLVIRKFVWGEDPDGAVLARAQSEEIPSVLAYLERQVPQEGFLFGPIGISDIAIASFLRNAQFVGFRIDAAYPLVAAYIARVLDHNAFESLRQFEELCIRTPLAQHRKALQEAGAPISDVTLGTAVPQRGVLSI